MNNDCTDRDLLATEPTIFAAGGFESQQLIAGNDAAISQTVLTSASAGFDAAGVQPGMVVCVYESVPNEGRCYEILAVDSPTTLTVSVLRAGRDAEAIAPPAGANLSYHISTFAPQIAGAGATLMEKLRQIAEAEGIVGADYVDSAQLRRAISLAALASIFTARASNAINDDANWVKAEHYRRLHVEAVAAIRLAKDIDGDGLAEHTRTLGNVALRRI